MIQKERADHGIEGPGVLDVGQVPCVLDQAEPRMWRMGMDLVHEVGRRDPVKRAHDQQERHPDIGVKIGIILARDERIEGLDV